MAGAIIPVITPRPRADRQPPSDLFCRAHRMSFLSIIKPLAAGVVAQKLTKAVG